MQQDLTFELKGQARRLRTALQEMSVPVTHVVALNLIARAQGQKNWETLEAALKANPGELPAPSTAVLAVEETHQQWMNWLEAALLSQGYDELDLDDIIHDMLSPKEASSLNNQGLSAQLQALYDWHLEGNEQDPAKVRCLVVEHLERENGNLELPIPQSMRSQGMPDPAIPAIVSVLAGSPLEQSLEIDCLEWFANQDAAAIDALLLDGLRNTSCSDDVALWLEENSLNEKQRESLQRMLDNMRQVLSADTKPVSNLVGVTVSIDEDAAFEYLRTCVGRGLQLSAEAQAIIEE
jgi:hypothetical protein